ncbi:hypothetical protein ACOSP7_003946 [Xanthoceras sorbifolium]
MLAFLLLEAISICLDLFRGIGVVLASFVLALIVLLFKAFSATNSRTELERNRNIIEFVFSVVQLIMASVHLALSFLGVEINNKVASIFLLIPVVAALALAFII